MNIKFLKVWSAVWYLLSVKRRIFVKIFCKKFGRCDFMQLINAHLHGQDCSIKKKQWKPCIMIVEMGDRTRLDFIEIYSDWEQVAKHVYLDERKYGILPKILCEKSF